MPHIRDWDTVGSDGAGLQLTTNVGDPVSITTLQDDYAVCNEQTLYMWIHCGWIHCPITLQGLHLVSWPGLHRRVGQCSIQLVCRKQSLHDDWL